MQKLKLVILEKNEFENREKQLMASLAIPGVSSTDCRGVNVANAFMNSLAFFIRHNHSGPQSKNRSSYSFTGSLFSPAEFSFSAIQLE